MKAIYKTPLRVVLNSLRHYQQIEAGIEETNGLNFFPENAVGTVGETTLYTLRFNPKVQTLLALYDLAMDGGIDTGEAIVRYSLFHAALELYQRLLAEPGWLPETLDRLYLYTMDRQIEVLQSGGVTELPSRRSVIRMFWSSGVPLPARFKALLGGILGQKACSVYCFICKMLHV